MAHALDIDWSNDNQRRIKDYDSSLTIGDVVSKELKGMPITITITGFGEQWDDGGRFAYGDVDVTPIVELFKPQLGGAELTAEMEEMARQNLRQNQLLSDWEIDAIIAGLK